MSKSKVYFTDFHATPSETLPQKLHRLMKRAGFEQIDFADNSTAILSCKIAEYAYAVVKDRPAFHISLICDVSPFCDCHAENDVPIIPDVGMLASFDPVALDQACVDLCNKMPVIDDSRLDRHLKAHGHEDPNHEYFHMNHPDAEWETCLIHAEKIGIGTRAYELVKI